MNAPPVPVPAVAPRAVSVKDAAKAMGGISERKIFYLISSGQLRSIKVGGRRLITVNELDRFIAAREAETT